MLRSQSSDIVGSRSGKRDPILHVIMLIYGRDIIRDPRRHTIVAPHLAEVFLTNCIVWVESTRLELYQVSFDCPPAERPTITQFLEGFRHTDLSHVDCFSLSDVFDVESTFPDPAMPSVLIPTAAHSIIISDTADNVIRLSSFISWTPSTFATIESSFLAIPDLLQSEMYERLCAIATFLGEWDRKPEIDGTDNQRIRKIYSICQCSSGSCTHRRYRLLL